MRCCGSNPARFGVQRDVGSVKSSDPWVGIEAETAGPLSILGNEFRKLVAKEGSNLSQERCPRFEALKQVVEKFCGQRLEGLLTAHWLID